MGLYTSTHSSFTFHSSNLCVVSKIMDEIRDLRSGSHGHREFRCVRTSCDSSVLVCACIGWVAFHEDTYEKHIKKPDVTGLALRARTQVRIMIQSNNSSTHTRYQKRTPIPSRIRTLNYCRGLDRLSSSPSALYTSDTHDGELPRCHVTLF